MRSSTRAASGWTCAFCQNARAFRSSALHRATLDKAPSVKTKERAKQVPLSRKPNRPRLDVDGKIIWPIALLKSANASGALQIGPADAVAFLDRYERLGSMKNEGIQELCQGIECVHSFRFYSY